MPLRLFNVPNAPSPRGLSPSPGAGAELAKKLRIQLQARFLDRRWALNEGQPVVAPQLLQFVFAPRNRIIPAFRLSHAFDARYSVQRGLQNVSIHKPVMTFIHNERHIEQEYLCC